MKITPLFVKLNMIRMAAVLFLLYYLALAHILTASSLFEYIVILVVNILIRVIAHFYSLLLLLFVVVIVACYCSC